MLHVCTSPCVSSAPSQANIRQSVFEFRFAAKLSCHNEALKPPKGRNLAESNLLSSAVSATLGLLDLFEEDPALAINLHSHATNQDAVVQPKEQSEFWPGYTKFKRVPRYWLGQYLVAISGGKLSQELCNKIDANDASAIRTLFHFTHQLSDTTDIPPPMLNKKLMASVLAKRHESLGNRLAQILNNATILNLETGVFCEMNINSFDLIVRTKSVVAVLHCTGIQVSLKIPITEDFVVLEHLSDMKAMIKYGVNRILLHELFVDVGVGPLATTHSATSLLTLANEMNQKLQSSSASSDSLAIVDQPNMLEDAESKRRGDILESARKKLKGQRESIVEKRTLRVNLASIPDEDGKKD
jgi:hypothetical protein